MYVLGHVVTAVRSGAFGPVDLLSGERVLELMLPDVLSSHDWGYEHCWRDTDSLRGRLVVAHMLGDAVVHYGPRWVAPHRRSGWAYLRMGQVARRYEEFWRTAAERGWRKPDAGPQDSRRGWAHSLVEYSIDQHLADHGDWSDLLAELRRRAAVVVTDPSWVRAYAAEAGVVPSKPLLSQPQRYCGALSRALEPDEIHLRGLAVKFGLIERPEVLGWLREWTRGIVAGVGADEIDDVLAGISDVISTPEGFGYPVDPWAVAAIPEPWPVVADQPPT
ncbi:hypothetical protein [Micromonospora sp. NPDC023644]|uniref:hypothetical protein n=1 Tax=Micromonospora sp. NPDC023644 TaxID=3154321 RepID=UPI0033C2601E